MTALLLVAAAISQQLVVEGNSRAAVRVVIYGSLQCKDTAAFYQALDEYLLPRYGSAVAFEHRHFPMAKQNWSRRAAMAAHHFDRASPEAGLAWRRYVLSQQAKINDANLEERVREFAREQSLDPTEAIRAMASTAIEEVVEADRESGVRRGVTKTPTVFVGEAVFTEKVRRSDVAAAIEKALGR